MSDDTKTAETIRRIFDRITGKRWTVRRHPRQLNMWELTTTDKCDIKAPVVWIWDNGPRIMLRSDDLRGGDTYVHPDKRRRETWREFYARAAVKVGYFVNEEMS